MSEGLGQPQRFCPNCGAQARADTVFCVSCGSRIEASDGRTEQSAYPRPKVPEAGRKTLLGQEEVRLVSIVVGALLLLVTAYLLLSYSAFLGCLLIVLAVLAVLVLRNNRGSQTEMERRLFEAVGWYGQSARKAYEEGRHRELAQSAYQQSRKAYEGANTRYQEWNEKQAAERERDEALRRVERERGERRTRFDRYRRFFERAHEGSRKSLDWWRAYDTGEFDSDGSTVSDLLLSAQNRAERGLDRLREMEGTFSDVLEREEFKKADLLLDGVVAGQENFEGEESVFVPLVAVHERIKQSESWGNYRQQLERFVKDLEDILESPNVRTAAANRVRFPDPDKPRFSDTGRSQPPNPHTTRQTGSTFCQRCGAENGTQAAFCQNCGGSLQQTSTATGAPTASRSSGVIVAGYVFAFLGLIVLPIIFLPVAIVLGIVNIARGDTGHGVAQILISASVVLLGAFMGWLFLL